MKQKLTTLPMHIINDGQFKPMYNYNELLVIGLRTNYLTVIKKPEKKGKVLKVFCRCRCGIEKYFTALRVAKGKTKSCGCIRHENKSSVTHGKSTTSFYSIFTTMISRCEYSNNERFIYYGGRGIKVCEEWRNNFQSFYEWAQLNGYKKGLEIDRIDNDGNYEPSNCRWVTKKVNARNKRKTILINGKPQGEILEEYLSRPYTNQEFDKFRSRIRLGWDVNEALKGI